MTDLFDFMWPTAEAQHQLFLVLSIEGSIREAEEAAVAKKYPRAHLKFLASEEAMSRQTRSLPAQCL